MPDYEHLHGAFTARDLAIPMPLAFTLAHDCPAAAGANELRARNFDQAPVLQGGRIVGFVLRRRLEEPGTRLVGDVTVSVGPPNIVSANASVADLLDWIADPGFLFVLEGRELMGFVTVADFNKQPCRAYLYLLLATFEIGLADYLRHQFRDRQTEIFDVVQTSGGRAAHELYEADVAANIDADPVSYLGFPQLLDAVGRAPIGLQFVGAASRSAWDRESGSLVALRNSVMHPTRSLVDAKAGLLRLREQRDRLLQLSARFQLER